MQPIKTALLSFGMSGKVFHAPFIELHPGFQLAGAWERSTKIIQQIYPETKSYATFAEVLNDREVELVIVNTPTYTHYDYAKQALLAGKHIIVEKAFTTTVKEAEELKELSIQQNKTIGVYQNRRYDSDFKTVQKLIREGCVGDINEVEIHFDRFKPTLSPKKHKEIPGPGAGILKDLGAHIIDQALCLFGMPAAVFADIRITRPLSQVDDDINLLLYYPTFRVRLK
ncbi:MAG TPA: Gfo/Idh/MocA family oxidoreductase, partial [Ferruginibacter sp.]|nr:Gfo/Idh/MocA family oxidoreductase [Ferruginibacter sp.]